MYWWRGKIGLLVPLVNDVVEREFHLMAPDGVSIHTARVVYRTIEPTVKANFEANDHELIPAAKRLASVKPNVVIWACTTASFIGGVGYNVELSNKIEEAIGIPALTTSTAVLEAFKRFGFKKVAIATPYIEEVNEKEKAFFEGNGYEVTEIRGMQVTDAWEEGTLLPSQAYRLAREVDSPEADGVFISCTDFRAAEVIEVLENDLMKPVVTSNQASMWACLRNIGVRESIRGFGTLLEDV